MIGEDDIRRIVREEIAAVLKGVAEEAQGDNRWEYDSVKSTALYTVQDLAMRAAERALKEGD